MSFLEDHNEEKKRIKGVNDGFELQTAEGDQERWKRSVRALCAVWCEADR